MTDLTDILKGPPKKNPHRKGLIRMLGDALGEKATEDRIELLKREDVERERVFQEALARLNREARTEQQKR